MRSIVASALAGLALVFCDSNTACSGEWKTLDGNIAVATPDPTRFVAADPIAPALAIWEAEDGTIRLLIAEMAAPPNARLIQSGLEKGLLKEIKGMMENGELVTSPVEQREGYSAGQTHQNLPELPRVREDGRIPWILRAFSTAVDAGP